MFHFKLRTNKFFCVSDELKAPPSSTPSLGEVLALSDQYFDRVLKIVVFNLISFAFDVKLVLEVMNFLELSLN